MALDHGTISQRRYTNHGTLGSASLDQGSCWAWIYPVGIPVAGEQPILVKADGSTSYTGHWRFHVQWNATNLVIRRNTAGTDCRYITNDNPLVDSAWNFCAAVWDAGTSSVTKIFWGDLSTSVAERSYGTTDEGSSTVDDVTSNNLYVGDYVNVAGGGFAGIIGPWGLSESTTLLTAADFEVIRRNFVRPYEKIPWLAWCVPGRNGANSVDYSGNVRNGTVTGATKVADVPIRSRIWLPDTGATVPPLTDVFFENRHGIEQGMKPLTAAGMGGVLVQ